MNAEHPAYIGSPEAILRRIAITKYADYRLAEREYDEAVARREAWNSRGGDEAYANYQAHGYMTDAGWAEAQAEGR